MRVLAHIESHACILVCMYHFTCFFNFTLVQDSTSLEFACNSVGLGSVCLAGSRIYSLSVNFLGMRVNCNTLPSPPYSDRTPSDSVGLRRIPIGLHRTPSDSHRIPSDSHRTPSDSNESNGICHDLWALIQCGAVFVVVYQII